MKKLIALGLVIGLMVGQSLAITAVTTGKTVMGPNIMFFGTFSGLQVSTWTTAETFSTGLSSVRAITVTPTRGAVSVRAISGGTVTVSQEISTVPGLTSGFWHAIGR